MLQNIRSSQERKLLLATKNQGKIAEFSNALSGCGAQFLSFYNFPDIPPIIEDGSTFLENALKKARSAFSFTGLPALADDSGLEVDYLNGAPGVLSARFAGLENDDCANNNKLLHLLTHVPFSERTARFRCVLAVVTPDEREISVEGTLEGYIALQPRGKGGFGYDPLFWLPEYNCTVAELGVREKNGISHRGQALAKLQEYLYAIFA